MSIAVPLSGSNKEYNIAPLWTEWSKVSRPQPHTKHRVFSIVAGFVPALIRCFPHSGAHFVGEETPGVSAPGKGVLMRTFVKSLWLPLSMILTTAMCWGADGTRVEPNPPGYEATVDRIFAHETQFVQSMRQYTPLVETYIQQVSPDNDLGERPTGDHYFMGRLIFDQTITQKSFEKKRGGLSRTAGLLTDAFKIDFLPLGFMQFIFFDTQDLNCQTYDLKYLRREFLGQVRCMVFDVVPQKGLHRPHFLGRIWVEDQDSNIVRLNGTYAPQPKFHYFLHFDSWRLNVHPGMGACVRLHRRTRPQI